MCTVSGIRVLKQKLLLELLLLLLLVSFVLVSVEVVASGAGAAGAAVFVGGTGASWSRCNGTAGTTNVAAVAAGGAVAAGFAAALGNGPSLVPPSVVQDGPVGVVLGAVSVGLALLVGSLVLLDTTPKVMLTLSVAEVVPELTLVDISPRCPLIETVRTVHFTVTERTLVDVAVDKLESAVLAVRQTAHHVTSEPTHPITTLHCPFHFFDPVLFG